MAYCIRCLRVINRKSAEKKTTVFGMLCVLLSVRNLTSMRLVNFVVENTYHNHRANSDAMNIQAPYNGHFFEGNIQKLLIG